MVLQGEQRYVFEIARELGVELSLIYHKRPTISCEEKLELLKEENSEEFSTWTSDRIVKSLYFHSNSDPYVGVITPEFGRNVKAKDVLSKTLKISRGKAEKYWVDPNHVPNGMSWGTCTPFPLASSIGTEISDLIFLDYPPIKNKLVNISVGGTDKRSFITSMHLPYGSIYDILKKQFQDRVHILT